MVELHTGAYCEAVRAGDAAEADAPCSSALREAAAAGRTPLGLEVHAGHGIDYETVGPIAAIPQVVELNIGHFLIGEAIFVGLEPAIRRMRALMDEARARRVIIGLGSDLSDIRRIQDTLDRFGERFIQPRLHRDRARPLRPQGRPRRQLRQALRRQGGLRQGARHRHARAACFWRDMGVVNLRSGKPTMALTGGAAERLAALIPPGMQAHIHVSLTDDHPYAQAFVIIEAAAG